MSHHDICSACQLLFPVTLYSQGHFMDQDYSTVNDYILIYIIINYEQIIIPYKHIDNISFKMD